MHLAFISPSFEVFSPVNSTSVGIVEYDLCRAAESAGASPYVIARRSHYQTFDWPHKIFVDYPWLPPQSPQWWWARAQRKFLGGKRLGDYTYVKRIAHTLARQKLDRLPLIVHCQPDLAICLRKRFPHAFIAFWSHGKWEDDAQTRKDLKSAIDLAIGVSDFQSHWLKESYSLKSEQVATIYNGIDTQQFSPSPDRDGSTPGVITITYTGRITRNKGLDVLLCAALEVAQTRRDFKVRIIGSDRLVGHLEAANYRRTLQEISDKLEQRGIELEWLGHVGREDVLTLLRASDIHVMPTRRDEAFGLSAVEAMACGVATIVSRTGGAPEVVGDAALLFERENAADLAKQLHALMDDALRREYSRRGLKRAREFSRERMWTRLCEVLEQAKSSAA